MTGYSLRLATTFENPAMGRTMEALSPAGLPTETFAAGGTLAFAGERLEYTHTPPAHTDGDVENDSGELLAIRQDLGVRSSMAAPIHVAGGQPGVVLVSSSQPQHFTEDQLHLLQFVAYWIGLVARDQSSRDVDSRDSITRAS